MSITYRGERATYTVDGARVTTRFSWGGETVLTFDSEREAQAYAEAHGRPESPARTVTYQPAWVRRALARELPAKVVR